MVLIDDTPLVVYAKQRGADWRHNLDLGARPVLLPPGTTREACVALAIRAARAIGIRFASVDIVRVADEWKVLEINSGVMMETLGQHHPDLVASSLHRSARQGVRAGRVLHKKIDTSLFNIS